MSLLLTIYFLLFCHKFFRSHSVCWVIGLAGRSACAGAWYYIVPELSTAVERNTRALSAVSCAR